MYRKRAFSCLLKNPFFPLLYCFLYNSIIPFNDVMLWLRAFYVLLMSLLMYWYLIGVLCHYLVIYSIIGILSGFYEIRRLSGFIWLIGYYVIIGLSAFWRDVKDYFGMDTGRTYSGINGGHLAGLRADTLQGVKADMIQGIL